MLSRFPRSGSAILHRGENAATARCGAWVTLANCWDSIACRLRLGTGRLDSRIVRGDLMSTYMPKEVRDGLDAARIASLKKASRLRVQAGDDYFRVLRLWNRGFAVDAETVPPLRGLVDLYDGARYLYQCLIVASEEERGEMVYEFKRSTAALDRAPLDYARDPNAPVALLTKD